MITRLLSIAVAAAVLTGCTTERLQTALGTPKNPPPIFSKPRPPKGNAVSQQDFIEPLYEILLEAREKDKDNRNSGNNVGKNDMRRYLGAGFALSDIYCASFFGKTDEAYRRRRFGRTLTNDVGTAMTTVLGLAKAGANVVTGVAAAVGLADSAWRNYDDSFVVSPDLSNVQSLVFAAQDNFRARTLAPKADLPADYGTAQSVILRYANICSFLGMKSLLDQSAGDQRNKLIADSQNLTATGKTEAPKAGGATPPAAPAKGAVPTPAGQVEERPVTAQPALTANREGN